MYYYEQKNYEETAIYANALYKMGFSLPLELLKIIQLSVIK